MRVIDVRTLRGNACRILGAGERRVVMIIVTVGGINATREVQSQGGFKRSEMMII